MKRLALSLWTLVKRAAYTEHVQCKACPEVWHPMFGEPSLCPSCDRLLRDSRSRTTSKPKREWPVAVPKVRRIAGQR